MRDAQSSAEPGAAAERAPLKVRSILSANALVDFGRNSGNLTFAIGGTQGNETVDTYASLHAALDQLPPNHARVLRRYYLEEATLDDISGELGVSIERVRQIREAAEKKLRGEFVVLALWQSVMSRH